MTKNSTGSKGNEQRMGRGVLAIPRKLFQLIRQPPAPGCRQPYSQLRNAIRDIMAEGRRKNIVNLLFEADLTQLRLDLARANQGDGLHCTLTACMAAILARTVAEDRSIQAYRLGSTQVVVFDHVDLAMMIEREIGGHSLPVVHIIRSAEDKGLEAIQREIDAARVAPLGEQGPLSRLEKRFFNLPSCWRRLVWFFIRRNPYLFKQLAGTVGLTSLGMHGTSGAAVVLPITPMTLTLSIGSIGRQLVLVNGSPEEREVIRLNLGADHDLIDGVPLMRFAERFRKHLERGLLSIPPPLSSS